MMRSRVLLNLGLLVLVGVLTAIVVLEPGKEPEPKPQPLTTRTPDTITKLKLVRGPDDVIELEKRDGSWWLIKPWSLPARDFRVQGILRLLEADSQSRHSLAALDPARFGLEKPRASVTFDGELTIDFGGTEPLAQRRYVRIGEDLHTIIDTFYYQIAATPESFVDPALLPPEAKPVRLVLPDLALELKDGKWQRTPEHPELSADASIELVDAWRQTQALEVRPKSKLPETRPAGQAEVWLEGQDQPLRFTLLEDKDNTYLQREDVNLAWQVTKDTADKLLKLRDEKQETAGKEEPKPEKTAK